MHPSDLQQEYNRLSQAYREMADEELESVAAEAYDLTDIARQALSFEISSRGLKISLALTPPPSEEDAAPLPPADDGFVPADEDLVVIERAENMQDLLNTKSLLDRAQIECFLGAEKVHTPGELTSSFAGGLPMRVWRPAYAQAVELLSAQKPGYAERLNEKIPDSDIRCPKCNSDGVIFEESDVNPSSDSPSNSSKYYWRCDDCGHEWEDDGVER